MNAGSERQPVWPLWLWALQLPLPAFAVTVAAWRLAGGGPGSGSAMEFAVLLLAGSWLAAAATLLFTGSGRRWLLRWRRQWLLATAGCVLGLALLDFGLTALGIVPTLAAVRTHSIEYTMGRFTSFRMVPKDVRLAGGRTLHVNSRGFRGPEIAASKPADSARIAFLGGSQVLDFHGIDWPAASGALLRDRGYGVEVINAGVAGYNSTDSLATLITDLWVLEPDVIVLCHGWNDIKYFPRITPGAPYRGLPPTEPTWWQGDWRLRPSGIDRLLTVSSLYRVVRGSLVALFVSEEGRFTWDMTRVPVTNSQTISRWGVAQFAHNLHLVAVLARRIGAEFLPCKQAWFSGGNLASGIDADEYGARNLFLPPAEIDRAFEAVYREVDAVASRHGLSVIDMRPLAANPDNFRDAVHFSESGSRAAAARVARALETALSEFRSVGAPD